MAVKKRAAKKERKGRAKRKTTGTKKKTVGSKRRKMDAPLGPPLLPTGWEDPGSGWSRE